MDHSPIVPAAQTDRSLLGWSHKIASKAILKPGQGAVLCIELKDRSRDGGELTQARLRAIWGRLEKDFGGALGLGFLDHQRGLVLAQDESAWISMAAVAVEAAIGTGMAGHDIGVGVGLARMESRDQGLGDVIRLSSKAAHEACDSGIGLAQWNLAQEAREERAAILRKKLRAALGGEVDDLRVIFQPKVDAQSKQIAGAEALVRFRCAEVGEVSAVELLSIAEACGELDRLDRWVLGLVVECQAQFGVEGIEPVPISVNVRAATAFAPGFTEFLGSLLGAFGVAPHLVEIELREGETVKNIALSERVISSLRELGISVALDDFGTRRTTLADLHRLRVSSLKLDRSIVREMISDPSVRQIAHGMLHLARVLDLGTVAVGIETEEQAAHLASAGCRTLQGFHFYQPMESKDFVRCLQELGGPALAG